MFIVYRVTQDGAIEFLSFNISWRGTDKRYWTNNRRAAVVFDQSEIAKAISDLSNTDFHKIKSMSVVLSTEIREHAGLVNA